MGSLAVDVLKIIEPIIKKVHENRDICLSVYITYDSVNINVYPYEDDYEKVDN